MKFTGSTGFLPGGILIILFFTIQSCKVARQGAVSRDVSCQSFLQTVADSMICQANSDSSYYLCQNKNLVKDYARHPYQVNNVMIIKWTDGDTIFNEKILGGSARWFDRENAEIFSPAGIPGNNLKTTFLFNVKSGKKTDRGAKNE